MKKGYEPGDPVQVKLPFEAKGEKLVREGVVTTQLTDGRFRIVFNPATDIDGCEIEQAVVHQKHFM